jgi:hypothetical protein
MLTNLPTGKSDEPLFYLRVSLIRLARFCLLTVGLLLTIVGSAKPGPLAPGDILAIGSHGVVKVDPVTGVQTVLSSGGLFTNPTGIAVDASGNIFVA